MAYDDAKTELEPAVQEYALRVLVAHAIETNAINPWCGICGSRSFTYEDRPSKYATMEDAEPELAQLEAENARARAVLQNKN